MSSDLVQEDIPGFIRRIGDKVLEGSNNSLLVLGTDRAKKGPASIDDGLGSVKSPGGGKGSGAALLVVGRKDKDGNPDFDNDSAFLYLSMNTSGDSNLGTSMEGDGGKGAYGIIKSDGIRIIGRKDIKISTSDGKGYLVVKGDSIVVKVGSTTVTIKGDVVTVDSAKIELGKGATLGAVLVDQLVKFLTDYSTAFSGHTHTTALGPSGPPIPTAVLVPPTISDLASKRTLVDPG